MTKVNLHLMSAPDGQWTGDEQTEDEQTPIVVKTLTLDTKKVEEEEALAHAHRLRQTEQFLEGLDLGDGIIIDPSP